AEVVNLDAIDVVAFAPPSLAGKLQLGQTAKVPGVEGTVTFIAKQAQADTGNVLIKARFDNKDQRYRASQAVRLEVETQKKKSRLVIPESALMEDHDPPFVVIAQEVGTKVKEEKEYKGGKARKVYAHIGVRDRDHHTVEILRLEDPEKKDAVIEIKGTLFLIEGGHGLHDGDELKIEEAKH